MRRLAGCVRIVMQRLVERGRLHVTDFMVNDKNIVIRSTLTFELLYTPPGGSPGPWRHSHDLTDDVSDRQHLLADDDQLSTYSSSSNVSRGV